MTAFFVLFQLYLPAFLLGIVSAPTLNLLGLHLAERDRAMQTLCANQASLLGVLVGMVIASWSGFDGGIIPSLLAVVFSVVTFSVSDRIARSRKASKNSYFTAIYLVLTAVSYLLSAVIPALENHLSQIFFGDLATLHNQIAWRMTLLMGGALVLLIYYQRVLFCDSFEDALFGEAVSYPRTHLGFQIFSSLLLSLSVQHLGFLYTSSLLFLATCLLSHRQYPGLLLHMILCLVTSTVATGVGILVSLYFSRLPTVPTIIVMIGAMAFCVRLVVYRTQAR